MRRKWHPYTEWEDYQAGMYAVSDHVMRRTRRQHRTAILAFGLRDAMADVVLAWPIAAEHNLSDTSSNRRAMVGTVRVQPRARCNTVRYLLGMVGTPRRAARRRQRCRRLRDRDVGNGGHLRCRNAICRMTS